MNPSEISVGVLGAGDMGRLYAEAFARANYRVHIADVPQRYAELRAHYATHRTHAYATDLVQCHR
jgi:prephenate dehydrogenase